MPRNRSRKQDDADGIHRDVLRLLQGAEILTCRQLPRGSNYSFVVELQNKSGEAVQGVYKPRQGEAPLWDFPNGTLCQRERAAYLVSQALGWGFIPPTVLRDGPYGTGSVQQFVQHDPQQHYFTLKAQHVPAFQRMCAFDWLINNADRKAGHCLLGSDGNVFGIDHGLTFHSMRKLRTVIWDFAGQPIPDDILTDLDAFGDALAKPPVSLQELATLIDAAELAALKERQAAILARKRFHEQHEGGVPWPWL